MSREHPPCSACAKFVPAQAGTGDCIDHDRPANADDPPCVLFLARGSREAQLAERTEQQLLAEIERNNRDKTWKRQSYTKAT